MAKGQRLKPEQIVTSLASQLPTLKPGALLQGADASLQKDLPQEYLQYWNRAQTSKFGLVPL